MPLQATSGAASYDAFGGGVAAVPNYIEDVFSTWLYTGNGSTQTITNGIDLAGKGGLVWTKYRASAVSTTNNILVDTVRGPDQVLVSNNTSAQANVTNATVFGSTGFTMGVGTPNLNNENNATYASWTFREQPKFFDVVTYTGNGTNARQVSHSLGSSPGFVIIKRTDSTGSWWCWHSSFSAATDYMRLNTTEAVNALGTITDLYQGVSSTAVTVGTNSAVNGNGFSYVMYVFAHNAGGFGLTGTDNVISCGSYTGNASSNGPTITLGYEPQWLLVKASSLAGEDWFVVDNMRGFTASTTGGSTVALLPNSSAAENNYFYIQPRATGFQVTDSNGAVNGSGQTYIYIAIRRGPMKVPTTGTSVFSAKTYSGNSDVQVIDVSQPYIDSYIVNRRPGSGANHNWLSRLTGPNSLVTNATNVEDPLSSINWASQDLAFSSGNINTNDTGVNYVAWTFRRAPGFFDEVCYTGNGTAGAAWNHNLGVAPELIIVKQRSTSAGTRNWISYSATTGINQYLYLNTTDAASSLSGVWHTAPTASVFYTNNFAEQNTSGSTYVAYLFASCPGVSKVGSYTGNGSSQTINCGFTGGARFVMIKRTDSTGDWYVWDTARGIVSGNDPHLSLNTTAAEVTSNDTIDTDSTGFVVNQVSATNVNVSSATYIFLAIA